MFRGLIQRRGGFYYRQRVPADLVAALGRREVKRSLKTRNPAAARLLGAGWGATCERAFAMLRAGLVTPPQAVALIEEPFTPPQGTPSAALPPCPWRPLWRPWRPP